MKTTKQDFEIFQEYCESWINKLGMKNWSIFYSHDNIDDSYARTYWKLTGGVATIVFGKYWDNMRPKSDTELNRLALHEVLHILMAPIIAEATDRFTNQNAIDIAEHSIIRSLENIVV